MAAVLNRMRLAFNRHPVIGNMVICGTMYGSGDISQQTIRKFEKYDLKNAARVATVASVFFGPILYKWYKVLDKLIIGKSVREITLKVLVDQLVIAPPCICIFYVATSVLEGREDKFAELKEKGLKTFITGSVYWPIVQSVNFFFLPTQWRTAYVSAGAFVWTNILCFIKSQNIQYEDTPNTEKKESNISGV